MRFGAVTNRTYRAWEKSNHRNIYLNFIKFAVQGEVPFIELTLFYIELTLTTQLYRKPVSRQQEGAGSSENFFTDG